MKTSMGVVAEATRSTGGVEYAGSDAARADVDADKVAVFRVVILQSSSVELRIGSAGDHPSS